MRLARREWARISKETGQRRPAECYRTGAGVGAGGVCAETSATTGYFAQPVNPVINAISISTSIVAFGIVVLPGLDGRDGLGAHAVPKSQTPIESAPNIFS
jgi:hypothetical protein